MNLACSSSRPGALLSFSRVCVTLIGVVPSDHATMIKLQSCRSANHDILHKRKAKSFRDAQIWEGRCSLQCLEEWWHMPKLVGSLEQNFRDPRLGSAAGNQWEVQA
uniref:Uncharacterized protein n=1 Tax=Coccidioides posadasii RMSCC 3488 TaxID=454284 RepID=A0A0J6IDU3_COCPO|nr:hypothetical protein CPAG_06220 [Coccidioides posadasii RMSCC 3488]